MVIDISFNHRLIIVVSKILQDLTNKYIDLKRNLKQELSFDDFEGNAFNWENENDAQIWDFYENNKLTAQELFLLSQTKGYMAFDMEKKTKKLLGLHDKFPENGRVLIEGSQDISNMEIPKDQQGNDPIMISTGKEIY
jgi:hypothetical protein